MDQRTLETHPPRVELRPGNVPVVAPIYQSVKFVLPEFDDLRELTKGNCQDFFYTRMGNPTVRQLELLLAHVQGRDDAQVFGSGMGAIAAALMGSLGTGDGIVYFYESYKPSRLLIKDFLGRFGVKSWVLSIHDHSALARIAEQHRPKVIFFESPTNPLTYVANLETICAVARRVGAMTIMDNTFAGLHNHGKADVDVFVHSLTKFASGHGDAMGGALIANKIILDRLRPAVMALGGCMDPHAAFLILRGMKTYSLRYGAQSQGALAVAQFIESQPQVSRVFYPGLPSHPQHELARRQQVDFGAIIGFDLKGDRAGVARFVKGLELIQVTSSLGSTESLICPIEDLFASDLTPEEKALCGIGVTGLRLAIGTESVADLIADLKKGFQKI